MADESGFLGNQGPSDSWLDTFSKIVNTGVGAYGTITNARTAANVQQKKIADDAATQSSIGKLLPWILGGLALIAGGWLVVKLLKK